jgi:hypothetical protein
MGNRLGPIAIIETVTEEVFTIAATLRMSLQERAIPQERRPSQILVAPQTMALLSPLLALGQSSEKVNNPNHTAWYFVLLPAATIWRRSSGGRRNSKPSFRKIRFHGIHDAQHH